MHAEILATGEEIRTGAVLDSNSAHIARRLEQEGLTVVRHLCVGDDLALLAATLKEIGVRAEVAVVTGGLGPTVDDLSAAAAARAAGVATVLNPEALAAVEGFLQALDIRLSPSQRKQALLPEGADWLANPVGSAPGFEMVIGRCRFFFLPGVPHEMRRMLAEQVLPRLHRLLPAARERHLTHTVSVFGETEAAVGDRLAPLPEKFPGVRLGLRADFPQIQVKLYLSGAAGADLDQHLAAAAGWVRERLGPAVFSEGGEAMETVVGRLLLARKATLAVAESCTGGLICHWLTNVPGSSGFFLFGGVTYANSAKSGVLGVDGQTLARVGAVHEETAREMAVGVRRVAGATYGLATSGIAGPDGGSPEKPVGTVCIGLAGPQAVNAFRFRFTSGRRLANKTRFAMKALDLLRCALLEAAV
jgi:nicotinamide-nucleotide amidase